MKSNKVFNDYLADLEREDAMERALERSSFTQNYDDNRRRKVHAPVICFKSMDPETIAAELGYSPKSWVLYADGIKYQVEHIVFQIILELDAAPVISEFKGSTFKRALACQMLKANAGTSWRKIGKIHIFNHNQKTVII